MIYLKEFNTHADYEHYITGGDGEVYIPNVSLCDAENEVHYNNKYAYRVAYLESTGTQYIDTNIYPNGATKIELDYAAVISQRFLIGSRVGYSSRAFYFANGGTNGSDYTRWFLNYNNTYQIPNYSNDTNRHFLSMSNTVIFDDTTIATFTSASFDVPYYMCIFASNMNGNIEYGKYKVYSCKIYDNNVMVRDFVPVVDKNGVGCMYDKVSGELFYNQGTGNFIIGEKV